MPFLIIKLLLIEIIKLVIKNLHINIYNTIK